MTTSRVTAAQMDLTAARFTASIEIAELQAELADMLYSADPDCDHVIVDGDNSSGVKCAECPGWYCE